MYRTVRMVVGEVREALLGNLPWSDLRGKIEYAINLSTDISRIFKYEREHRNWLSHMFESKAPQHFSGAEIDLAVRKLKFLFRILLLHDINAEIEDGEVDRVCRNIDKWYEKNTLS